VQVKQKPMPTQKDLMLLMLMRWVKVMQTVTMIY